MAGQSLGERPTQRRDPRLADINQLAAGRDLFGCDGRKPSVHQPRDHTCVKAERAQQRLRCAIATCGAIRRARKLARKKLQREGLLPMKPRTDRRPPAGTPAGPRG